MRLFLENFLSFYISALFDIFILLKFLNVDHFKSLY